MTRALFGILLLASCRTPEARPVATLAPDAQREAAPEPPVAPAPASWRHNGQLTNAQGDALCAKELPDCLHPFGIYSMPPSPCARQGTLCTHVPSPTAGTWTCGCEECSSNADCKADEVCESKQPPCEHERVANRCLRGLQPQREPCLEPAIP